MTTSRRADTHRRRKLLIGIAFVVTSLLALNPLTVQEAEAQTVSCTGTGWAIGGLPTAYVYWNGGCSEVVAIINLTSYWYAYYSDWQFLASNPAVGYNTDSFSIFDFYSGSNPGWRLNSICGSAVPYNGAGCYLCPIGYLAWI